jgi:hypothetical protein
MAARTANGIPMLVIVLNTVLYNRIEEINNAVKKRQGKTLSSVSATDADSLFDS